MGADRLAHVVLKGELITLRPVREQDLGALYELMADLESRGAYFPLGVMSETALRAPLRRTGSGTRKKACC